MPDIDQEPNQSIEPTASPPEPAPALVTAPAETREAAETREQDERAQDKMADLAKDKLIVDPATEKLAEQTGIASKIEKMGEDEAEQAARAAAEDAAAKAAANQGAKAAADAGEQVAEKEGGSLLGDLAGDVPGLGNIIAAGKFGMDLGNLGIDIATGNKEDGRDRWADMAFDGMEMIPGVGTMVSDAETAFDIGASTHGESARSALRRSVFGEKQAQPSVSRQEPVDEAGIDDWEKRRAEANAAAAAQKANMEGSEGGQG